MRMHQQMKFFLRETWELWYWAMFYPSRLLQRLYEWSPTPDEEGSSLQTKVRELLLFQPNFRFISQYLLLTLSFSLPLLLALWIYGQPLGWLFVFAVLLSAYGSGLFVVPLGLHAPLFFALVYPINVKVYFLKLARIESLLPFLPQLSGGLILGTVVLSITLILGVWLLQRDRVLWARSVLINGATNSVLWGTWLSFHNWIFAVIVSVVTGFFLLFYRERIESPSDASIVVFGAMFGVVFIWVFGLFGVVGVVVFGLIGGAAGIVILSMAYNVTSSATGMVAVGVAGMVAFGLITSTWFGATFGVTFGAAFGVLFGVTGMAMFDFMFGWVFGVAVIVTFGTAVGVLLGVTGVTTLPLPVFLIVCCLVAVSLRSVAGVRTPLFISGTLAALEFGHLGWSALLGVPIFLISHKGWFRQKEQSLPQLQKMQQQLTTEQPDNSPQKTSVRTMPDQVNPEVERRLIGMVNGSRSTARRLVDREKVRHPGKPEQWYWEAAIESLIRDRN